MSAIPTSGLIVTPEDADRFHLKPILLGAGAFVLALLKGAVTWVVYSGKLIDRLSTLERKQADSDKLVDKWKAEVEKLTRELQDQKLLYQGITRQNAQQEDRIKNLESQLQVAQAEKLKAVSGQLAVALQLAAAKEEITQKELKIASLEREANACAAHADATETQSKIEKIADALPKKPDSQ